MNVQMKIDLAVFFLAVFVVLMIARHALRVEGEVEARFEASKRPRLPEVAVPAPFASSTMVEPRTEDGVARPGQLARASTY